MALLFTSSISSLSSPSSSTSRLAAQPGIRLCNKSITLHQKTFVVGSIQFPLVTSTRRPLIVKATSGVDGVDPATPESPPPPPPSDNKGGSVSVENLPLESKLQQKQEQQLKMKLAKKLRLRRKRLVRKRHLRKKGRWPPSKLKKNKNV